MSDLSSLSTQSLYDALEVVTVPASFPHATFTNWSKTYTCVPLAVFEPRTVRQCALIFELARREGKTVRAVGVGHSPSDLACTNEFMLRTTKLDKILEINRDKCFVVAEAGITLSKLHAALGTLGLAMSNLGSISSQTLAGVITTATHGSGINYGVISTHVLALGLLLADGTLVRCSRAENPDLFMASLCGLGSTGLLISVTLQVEPAFCLKEVCETIALEEAIENLDELASSGEHVRMWWFPQTDKIRLSVSDRTTEPKQLIGDWFWDHLIGYHVLQFLLFISLWLPDLVFLIGRLKVWLMGGKSVRIDDSYKVFNVDCNFPQYTSEWSIPYSSSRACLRELRYLFEREHADRLGARAHFPVEIRFSTSDDIWLSPSHGQKTTWIGIIQYKPYGFNSPYRKLFASFEEIMLKHGGRPHWAKAHPLKPEDLKRMYPRFEDFVRVLQQVDPHGILRNSYIQRHIFGKQGPQFDPRVFKPRHRS
ncbi:L-gulonolactone D-arabinono-1,4-lactone oxidase [Thelephora ganbajun]|uniref:L-gulonolactone D-arabinono-1,4-lactone oxidase n=1 Tax=Thelephora ganbajun TaxID=370292 RepID=A0ACB6ZJ09_THEGA|nr:L-gulonolactone D-arabinono-1,4-lactone oxidase [Thelephora ganbajun]